MKRQTKAETPGAALAEKKSQAQSLLSKYQPLLKKGKLKITLVPVKDRDAGIAALEKGGGA